MGKLKALEINIEEAINDLAVDINYEISEYIEEKRAALDAMAEDTAEMLAGEYNLELNDLSHIGIEPVDIAQDAWDSNVDY